MSLLVASTSLVGSRMTPGQFCGRMLALVQRDKPMPNSRLNDLLDLLEQVVRHDPSAEQFESDMELARLEGSANAELETWLLRAWQEARDQPPSTSGAA
jgi:hypothetical protein